jgi:nucleoside-diphosphate-sugar epimerase
VQMTDPRGREIRSNASSVLAQMKEQVSVLVTGADGFVGRHLAPYLADRGYKVIAASRAATIFKNSNIFNVPLPDLSSSFDWEPLLQQCDIVVHLAGIAHKYAVDELYNRVNHQATAALARAAFRCGTRHLVFVSSIAAQSGSFSDHELTETDPPKPTNAYGRSKLAAEKAVRESGVSFTILRPVVIYGEGEKGNFATVHKISRLPIPLPFGGLSARRSVLSIQNFNAAVATVLTNSSARGEIFIVSDPTPVTVADLIARYRVNLGRSSRLLPIPERWIELLLKVTGLSAAWERLGRPLVANPTKILAMGWNPTEPSSVHSGVSKEPPSVSHLADQ